jgi:AcrR family transcriptional regulator
MIGASATRPMADRRRDFVRLEIEKAGMDLFALRGYENVTVQEIADAAGIGRRTFFRHFRSKEELLQAYDTRLAVRALQAFRRRPPDEKAAVALCRAFLSTAEMPPHEEEIAFQRNKVLQEAGADALIAGSAELTEQFIDEAASRIEGPVADDIRPHLVVWTVFAAGRAVTRVWIADCGRGPSLLERLEGAFDNLLDGMRRI